MQATEDGLSQTTMSADPQLLASFSTWSEEDKTRYFNSQVAVAVAVAKVKAEADAKVAVAKVDAAAKVELAKAEGRKAMERTAIINERVELRRKSRSQGESKSSCICLRLHPHLTYLSHNSSLSPHAHLPRH